jgi:hypothetical protein
VKISKVVVVFIVVMVVVVNLLIGGRDEELKGLRVKGLMG